MKKILIITGPTATGKTALSLNLAKKFNGELVACDSRQVYQDLDIGTGKLPDQKVSLKKGKGWWEIDEVKVWMYDVTSLDKQYTVANYVKDASERVYDISARGKLPIIVGGTGLYLKALIEGLENLQVPIDKKLRNKLKNLTLLQLQDKLQKISPQRWEKLNNSERNNPRRLLRSIELLSMNPYAKTKINYSGLDKRFDVLKIGLTAPRQNLYKKSDSRILDWFNQGIIEEVKSLISAGVTIDRFYALGLEYSLIADFIQGKIESLEDLKDRMQGSLHSYIRRQQTWFKKDQSINWFDISQGKFLGEVEKLVAKWYDRSN